MNTTVGFETLARLTDRPSKSLHRMLSSNGNPSLDNLAAIFGRTLREQAALGRLPELLKTVERQEATIEALTQRLVALEAATR